MITLLYLDVLEVCLLNIPKDKTTVKIKPATIIKQLEMSASGTRKSTINKIRMILKTIFPIYKNKRKHTKCFKVKLNLAREYIVENDLLLRPIEHARRSYLQQEVK